MVDNNENIELYLQWTINIIRLLTVGGTPFEAIHRYAPMCNRFTRDMVNVGPSTLITFHENRQNEKII